MQHIQDKEFDQLFKDRFEEAEIAPSMNLWNNIEQELAPKRKRFFPVYWMAAAAVIVVLGFGLMFYQPQKVQLQGPAVAVKPAIDPSVDASVKNTREPAATVKESNKTLPVHMHTARVKTEVLTITNVPGADELKETGKKDLNAMQPIQNITRLTIKPAIVKQSLSELPKVQNQPEEQEKVKEAIVMANAESAVETKDEVSNENDQADKRGIRNVGDLVNYVVEKVDKREDKFIRFKTDDDDNSSLIGINIGMLKFSKRHK